MDNKKAKDLDLIKSKSFAFYIIIQINSLREQGLTSEHIYMALLHPMQR